jgi:hypothetical protein
VPTSVNGSVDTQVSRSCRESADSTGAHGSSVSAMGLQGPLTWTNFVCDDDHWCACLLCLAGADVTPVCDI